MPNAKGPFNQVVVQIWLQVRFRHSQGAAHEVHLLSPLNIDPQKSASYLQTHPAKLRGAISAISRMKNFMGQSIDNLPTGCRREVVRYQQANTRTMDIIHGRRVTESAEAYPGEGTAHRSM